MTQQRQHLTHVDVLLVNPAREFRFIPAHSARMVRSLGSYPPLGLACLAGALEAEGVSVAILDLASQPLSAECLTDELRALSPSVVGISSMTFTLPAVSCLLPLVRWALPHASLVLGGPCTEDYPREVLARFPELDIVVVGEGEVTFREIVLRRLEGRDLTGIAGTVYRVSGTPVLADPRDPVADLDQLPRPAYHLLDYARYAPVISRGRRFATMYTLRGCPFHCRYCHRQSWLTHVRYHTPGRVVSDMEHLVRDLGAREIKFYDETFTLDRARVLEVCRLIRERGLSVPWEIRTRPELLDRELASELARSGCYRVCIGIEGGSEERLRRMGRNTSLKQVRDAVSWARQCGLSTLAFFMIGYPGDARSDCEDVLRLARQVGLSWIVVAVTTAFANTPIYRELLDSGRLSRDVWRDYTLGLVDEIAKGDLTFDGLDYDRHQLDGMLKSLYWRFYLRPQQIGRILREIRSFKQLASLARLAVSFVGTLIEPL